MNRGAFIIALFVVAIGMGTAGYWLGHQGFSPTATATVTPSAAAERKALY
jgi:hypothetical protein